MKTMRNIETILSKEKDRLKEEFHVQSIGVFGSYVRGEERQGSDLDLLVEFDEPIGLFRYIELEEHLSELLGVKVDLVTKNALKPRIGKSILQEVVMI
ncbi:MAG: nucleotidyltransferase family protein [Desulfarculaceae bacterium]|nr:nucleotidyltransferase family protein [Desulfarculaceae bacterium]MCF8072428.1 nucleotidyltransferase family protein [Desulfarculaceae bacterium]MCF8102889.1 nucleotidyltransferase family protein [Desulfarculaceae bacterium]MCF8118471.1 nucleotidyltransferase family protein [Desulfarculaceae bacterium]